MKMIAADCVPTFADCRSSFNATDAQCSKSVHRLITALKAERHAANAWDVSVLAHVLHTCFTLLQTDDYTDGDISTSMYIRIGDMLLY